MKISKSELFVLAGGMLWGGIGVFFNMLSGIGFTQLQVVTIRTTTAALTLGLYLAVFDRAAFKIKLRDCWCFAGTGILSLLLFNWCYFTAIEETSLAVAVILLYTAPVFVMLLSAALFKERINARKIVALALTFCGCLCVAGVIGGGGVNGEKISFYGLICGVGSGVGYALYSIFGRLAGERGYSSATISEYTFIFAAAAVMPMSGIFAASPTFSAAPGTALTGAAGIGVLCGVLPFLLYTKGLAGMETGKAAILATIEPAVGTLLSCVLYGESIINIKGIGIIIILISVVVLNTGNSDKKQINN